MREAADSSSREEQHRSPRSIALGGGTRVPYPVPTDAAATAVGKSNKRTGNRPEVTLRSALHRSGLRFRKDYPVRAGAGRPIRVDIAFTRARLAIFVDGCFWHGCPLHGTTPKSNRSYWGPKLARNVERDRETDERLRQAGWDVLRLWEHVSVEDARAAVEQGLLRQRTALSRDRIH